MPNEFEFMDEDEQEEYTKRYVEEMRKLASGTELDDQNLIYDEMQRLRYNPTGDAAHDAEYNFLRAEKAARKRNRVEDKTVKSYGKFMKRADGLSDAEAKKKMREYLKGGE